MRRLRARCALLAALLGSLTLHATAQAQGVTRTRTAARPHRLTFGAAGLVVAPGPTATSTVSFARPDGTDLPIFRTDTRYGLGGGAEVQLGTDLSARLSVEGIAAWDRTSIRTRVSADLEAGSPATSSETLTRLGLGGGALWHVRTRGTTVVFLRAGGGWAREIVGNGAFAENAVVADFGAGIKYWRPNRVRGRAARVGLRLDARVRARSRGVAIGSGGVRVTPVVALGLLIRI